MIVKPFLINSWLIYKHLILMIRLVTRLVYINVCMCLVTEVCGGVVVVNNEPQIISSPGYFDHRSYNPGQECSWLLKVAQYFIELQNFEPH